MPSMFICYCFANRKLAGEQLVQISIARSSCLFITSLLIESARMLRLPIESLSLSKRTVLKVTCSADRSEASREKTHRSVWVAWETKRNLRVSRVAPDQTHLLFLHIYLLQLLFWHTELVKIVFHNTIFLFHSTENHRVPFWHFVNWSIHIDCSPPPFLL